MTFLFRILCAVFGVAFLFAVANLFVSGVPSTRGAGAEVAALATDQDPGVGTASDVPNTPIPAAETPGIGAALLQMLLGAIAPQAATQATPITAPSAVFAAAHPGQATPQSTPPLGAVHVEPKAAPEAAPVSHDALFDEASTIWRAWMAANGIESGALAMITPDGTEYGTGLGRTADEARPVMSLSKTITGLCVDQLLLANDLGWDTTLGDIAAQMSAAGLTPRPWNADITLASLATHTSGLAPDLTQSNFVRDTHGVLGLHRRWAAAALQEDAITGTPGEYFYNNNNYAVLGVVVEALSDRSYAQTCMDSIVTPAGITDAVIEGRYGSLSSFAGWEMSAMDFARLARHWFAPDQPHMSTPRPSAGDYSVGFVTDGRVTHHTGRFCQSSHATGGVGSLFIHRDDGTVISINWDDCTDRDIRAELVAELRDLL